MSRSDSNEDLMSLTTNRNDPELGHGSNDEPVSMNKKYLILSEEERSKGFVRPVRQSYQHLICGTITTMAQEIAETYARDPGFYGCTYCVKCMKHRPVDEFVWVGTDESVGS
jgi:hypothetical protein